MSAESRAARVAAMRAVFAALCNAETRPTRPTRPARPENILLDLPEDEEAEKKPAAKMKLARDIAGAFIRRRDDINAMLAAAARYESDEITLTERALICAGAAEMLARPKTPVAVVINEFLEIAKLYGAENSAKFVNAALDNIARRIRENRGDPP